MAQWKGTGLLTRRPGFDSHQSHGNFFQPNLLCFVLCYGFRVVRHSMDLGKYFYRKQFVSSQGTNSILQVHHHTL